jgi:hypothetical protein
MLTTTLTQMNLIIAQAPAAAPMGFDFSGPNALINQVFGFLVGLAALAALWLGLVKKKPAALLAIFACIFIAGFMLRFRDPGKVNDNDVYAGIEDIGGIGNDAPAPAPPATR